MAGVKKKQFILKNNTYYALDVILTLVMEFICQGLSLTTSTQNWSNVTGIFENNIIFLYNLFVYIFERESPSDGV